MAFASPAAARLVAILATALILAGCSSTTSSTTDSPTSATMTESEPMSQAFEELMKRPNLTQVDADYQSMFGTIRERLVAEVGIAAWVPDEEPVSGSSCGGPVANLEGAEVRQYDAGASPGNLPDSAWQGAVAIVAEVARHYGFGAPKVIVSGPGDHEVSFRDRYDGELLFGTAANTILGATTGCHLTEEAHRRGIPAGGKKV